MSIEVNEVSSAAQRDLQGTWVLEWMEGNAVDSTTFQQGLPRLEFNPGNSTVVGYTGCNNLNGQLTVGDNGSLTFGPIVTTSLFCQNVPEPAFLDFLERTNGYKHEDLQLTLLADGNPILRFNKKEVTQPNLEGDWILKSGIGTQLLPNTKITAEFKDGKLNGNGGCNQYFSGYTVEPLDRTSGKIHIGKIGSTLIFCSEEINAQESSYFQALEQVREYKLTDEGLILPYPSPSRYLLFTRQ
ncbi:MAG: META domain-containing protein [Prochloraceae cyanobacterium]|nr:META domain-containing protein [Prochloraceae cyanobacterium]